MRSLLLLLFLFLLQGDFSLCFKIKPPLQNAFIRKNIATGLNGPTDIVFAPDGRAFVSEKQGTIKVIKPDGSIYEWLDIVDIVNSQGDRGILSLALDPNFEETKWVFVLYVQDPIPGEPDESEKQPTQSVVVRYTEGQDGVALVDSAVFILGEPADFFPNIVQKKTGIPACYTTHTVGTILFAKDNTMFISSGDGARWDRLDDGENTNEYDGDCELFFGDEQDLGSWRSQSLVTLAGKILRIDPATGNGIGVDNFPQLYGNPFYVQGNPGAIQSKIWAVGLRNPFRMTLRDDATNPGSPGTLYISDVGSSDWEEIHVSILGGENFGWPCKAAFINADQSALYTLKCDLVEQDPPLIYYNHINPNPDGYNINFIGNCAGGLVHYQGTRYPSDYVGSINRRALFFSDYGAQWLRVAWVNEEDELIEEEGIQLIDDGLGPIVKVATEPNTGDIVIVSLSGIVFKLESLVAGTAPPTVAASANSTTGSLSQGPVVIEFSSDGSYDPEGKPLLFLWDFGDGSSSNEPNPTHTYNTNGPFKVTLTVTNTAFLSANSSLTIHTDNMPPQVQITSPSDNYEFDKGEVVQLRATGTDLESENLQYYWRIDLMHNNHFHPYTVTSDSRNLDLDLSTLVSDLERNTLEIYCTVTDENGATAQEMIRARPKQMINSKPNVQFTVDTSSGNAYLTVVTNAVPTDDDNMDYLYYNWNWGDGRSATTFVPTGMSHTYSTPGTYDITLTVVDIFGFPDSSSTQKQITVDPVAAFAPYVHPANISESKKPIEVSMKTLSPNGEIRYTMDGSDPTESSTLYSGPFEITETTTIKAKTFLSGAQPSPVTVRTYDFFPFPQHCKTKVFNCNAFTFRKECEDFVCSYAGVSEAVAEIPANDGSGNPDRPGPYSLVYNTYKYNAKYIGGSTSLSLWIDSKDILGQQGSARVFYDWEGDGTWDRIETFVPIATNPVPDEFENFNFGPQQILKVEGPNQNFQDMQNGAIRLEVWTSSFTCCALYLRTGDSQPSSTTMIVPFEAEGSNVTITLPPTPTQPTPSTTTGSNNDPDSTPGPIDSVAFIFSAKDCFFGGNRSSAAEIGQLPYVSVASQNMPPQDPSLVRNTVFENLNGVNDVGLSTLHLWVDTVDAGQAVQARVSFDFEGDGTWDRTELFELFAINDVAGEWENYASRYQEPSIITGSDYQPLNNGRVLLELWQSLTAGKGNPIKMLYGGEIAQNNQFLMSFLSIPYYICNATTFSDGSTTGIDTATTGKEETATPSIDTTTGDEDKTSPPVDATTGDEDKTSPPVDTTTGNMETTTPSVDATTGNVETTPSANPDGTEDFQNSKASTLKKLQNFLLIVTTTMLFMLQ